MNFSAFDYSLTIIFIHDILSVVSVPLFASTARSKPGFSELTSFVNQGSSSHLQTKTAKNFVSWYENMTDTS